MPWLAHSPDLLHIENLWDMIGCRLLRNANLATTRNEIMGPSKYCLARNTTRNNFQFNFIHEYHLVECIKKKGGYTQY